MPNSSPTNLPPLPSALKIQHYNFILSYLMVLKYDTRYDYIFTRNHELERTKDTLLYIYNGSCDIIRDGMPPIHASAGEVLYIPLGIKYISDWKVDKSGHLMFISCEFRFNRTYVVRHEHNTLTLPTGVQPLYDRPIVLKPNLFERPPVITFEHIYEDFSVERDINNFNCISEFYSLCGMFLSALANNKNGEGSPIAPAIEYIRSNPGVRIKNDALARLCAMSETSFYKKFREETGTSPTEYRNRLLARLADSLITLEGRTPSDVSEMLGFQNVSYFNRVYKKYKEFKE